MKLPIKFLKAIESHFFYYVYGYAFNFDFKTSPIAFYNFTLLFAGAGRPVTSHRYGLFQDTMINELEQAEQV